MNVIFSSIIYLLCNAISIYSKYKSMKIFFDNNSSEDRVNRKFEIFSFFSYFVINSLLFLIFNNPFVNLVNSLLIFFLLTFNYKSSVLKKIIATVLVYTVSFMFENFFYYMLSFLNMELEKQTLLAAIIASIIFYIAVLILSNLKNLKTNSKVSVIYIISIASISIFIIYISIVLMLNVTAIGTIHVIISISALLITIFFVIYIYDIIHDNYEKDLDNRLLEQQNNFYFKKLEMIQQSQENRKFLQHDMRNHFISMKSIFNDSAKIQDYINEFLELNDLSNDYAKSGNVIIDNILNYKFYEAQKKGIKVELKLQVPTQLNIRNFDLTVILGNLLDNAIEAASRRKDDKKIKVVICFDKNNFYINIINTFDGNLIFEDGKYQTINENKIVHGLGLSSVKRAIVKYNGEIEISPIENFLFSVKVLLYNVS